MQENMVKRVPFEFSEYSIPCGKKEKRKVYIVCNSLLAGNVHCDFSIRKDTFVENPAKFGKHKCCGTQIDNYFRPAPEAITIDKVTGDLIVFVGTSKLPMNIITSNSFKNYSLSLIKLGQDNVAADPLKLVPEMSRQTFTKLFITHSEQQYNAKLEAFKKAKGSCVAIDAGKHKTVPYLMVVLVNALISSSPLIVEAVRFFKGKSVDYAATIERILTSLLNTGVSIVAIVSDNLKSQVSAINHTSPNSMQHNTLNPQLAALMWISCSVHTLALSQIGRASCRERV